ncbi:MAG: hypothetical protein A2Y00_09975 [Omnitrophica WOR_2 bacterium GWF2_43_52]|nr:MAG: hypothetical protein A2062_07740 [Omnitrophica WOR_2 bacterium GWA2_44_7]OGX21558.1 MAG: hypothetical protein A2Y00_09975 [Omnitrophica WOR_2 bacterium GWF2_43_52]OGX53623.1 MAG: hypothetical protein A2460_00780 [Omnitrophica WOR_2 bacterium RIFOXYC2_FULL_43_9]HAH19443.1 hypothetical protein [Candidatus Omnitrophota bacterium]HBG63814.1 hypothetical protein [Candidatus Omnitrophota bacterium]
MGDNRITGLVKVTRNIQSLGYLGKAGLLKDKAETKEKMGYAPATLPWRASAYALWWTLCVMSHVEYDRQCQA